MGNLLDVRRGTISTAGAVLLAMVGIFLLSRLMRQASSRTSMTGPTPERKASGEVPRRSAPGNRRRWASSAIGTLAVLGIGIGIMAGGSQASAEAPLETMTTPQGTVIDVYSPLVHASDVYSSLLANGYGGNVAPSILRVEVWDDGFTATSSSVSLNPDGSYRPQSTIRLVSAGYLAHANNTVGHEYGHAWAYYYRWGVWNGSWESYLSARGLLGDPRVDSSYCWKAAEMIAEDYRQLLAAPDPAITGADQCNFEIPEAAYVPGLRDSLALTWTAGDPPPTYGGAVPVPTPPSNPTATSTPVPLPPTSTPLPPGPTVTPNAPSPTPISSTSVTIRLAKGWNSFVAPISGATSRPVYASSGKRAVALYRVTGGSTYWAKGPVTITITGP